MFKILRKKNAIPLAVLAGLSSQTAFAVTSLNVQIGATNASVGSIAVHVVMPTGAAGGRYGNASPMPVVEFFTGGSAMADFSTPALAGSDGLVVLYPAFPGQSVGGISTGGTFDYRGPVTAGVMADVARFAAGLNTTTAANTAIYTITNGTTSTTALNLSGKTLSQVVQAVIGGAGTDVNNIGFLGYSNGGNLAIQTLGQANIPTISHLMTHETPIMDFTVTQNTIAGGATGVAGQLNNPSYTPGTCVSPGMNCSLDLSTLKMDINTLQTETDPLDGSQYSHAAVYFDTNGDGVMQASEFSPNCFSFRPTGTIAQCVYSQVVADKLEALYGSTLLSQYRITRGAYATTYWSTRVASTGTKRADALAKNPNLKIMVMGTAVDHGSQATDHPHIALGYKAWKDAGAKFVRLNPDKSYIEKVVSPTEACANWDYDTAANVLAGLGASANATDILFADMVPASSGGSGKLVPTSCAAASGTKTISRDAVIEAMTLEMADRTHDGNWTANLNASLH